MEESLASQITKCFRCKLPYVKKSIPNIKKTFYVAQCNCSFDLFQKTQRQLLVRELWRYSKIPVQAWHDDMLDWKSTVTKNRQGEVGELLRFVTDFLKGYTGESCLIAGLRGTGKTRMSWYILTRLAQRNLIRGYYVTSSDLYNLFEKWEARQDVVEHCVAVELLLIDDLAESKIDTWNRKYLYNIINKRYVQKRPVIINTMRRLEVLRNEGYLGEHLISRIFEMAGSHVYEIKEKEDRRYIINEEDQNGNNDRGIAR